MRKFNQPSFAALTLILLICFSGIVIFNACRKTDRTVAPKENTEIVPGENSGMSQKFFSAHNSSDSIVKAVQNFVLRQNDKYHFIDDLVNRIGLPYWDKALIFSNNQTGNNHRSSAADSDSFNVVYIPFIRDTQNFVNASLIVKMTEADTAFRLLSDWQYSQFGFNDTDTGWNARDIFHIFAKLDNNVFGTETFRLTDENLLSDADRSALNTLGLPFDSVKIIYTFGAQLSNGRSAYAIQTEVCDPFSVCIEETPPGDPPPPRGFRQDQFLNNQSQGGSCITWLTGTVCTTVWVEVGGSGGGGNGSGGSGSGSSGGGGGGGWTPPQCSGGTPGVRSTQTYDPCAPGWIPTIEEATSAEFNYYSSPGIDLQKLFNCFNNIPDAGATYSIKILADLPRNCCPGNAIDNNLTPGHAFITLTKSNGAQSITQSFGFYPRNGPLSTTMAAVSSKMVDDGSHEYNASLSMNISNIDFNTVKNLALGNRSLLYDLNDYNCTDYALQCINIVRPSSAQITIGKVPGWGIINSTPNMLYVKLQEMKLANGPEAANIEIGVFNAPLSYGLCN